MFYSSVFPSVILYMYYIILYYISLYDAMLICNLGEQVRSQGYVVLAKKPLVVALRSVGYLPWQSVDCIQTSYHSLQNTNDHFNIWPMGGSVATFEVTLEILPYPEILT